jgi:tRNA modification GTPase
MNAGTTPPLSATSTIAAIATPPGVGALSIIRLSGPDARRIVGRLLPARGAERLAADEIRFFTPFQDPTTGERIDEGLVQVFPAPHSFTGEDAVELHGHGGRIAPERLLGAVLSAGAVAAGPGAFTRRALLHGKLDLLQAEAILDVIEARSEGLQRQAVYQLAGALSRRIAELRQTLVEAMAILELQIDFPEEDVDPPRDLEERLRDVRDRIASLVRSYAAGGILRHGVRVVIAGLPNVGKSSLFNCLLGEERAIVTRHAGTTRDAIEAEMSADGVLLRLVDTAGIREAKDEVEAVGVERARRQLETAQVVLLVLDATRSVQPEEIALIEDLRSKPFVVAIAKVDAASGSELNDKICIDLLSLANGDRADVASRPVRTSALTGEGREELIRTLLRVGTEGAKFEMHTPAVSRLRHKQLLESALQPLDVALGEVRGGSPSLETVAADLRAAVHSLESILGSITSEEVLDEIFSSFCIGK